jgi:hypothetical protein
MIDGTHVRAYISTKNKISFISKKDVLAQKSNGCIVLTCNSYLFGQDEKAVPTICFFLGY